MKFALVSALILRLSGLRDAFIVQTLLLLLEFAELLFSCSCRGLQCERLASKRLFLHLELMELESTLGLSL